MLEAHIAIDAPRRWHETIVKGHDAKVTILDWLHQDECCCNVYVEIQVAPGREQDLLKDLRNDPSISGEDLTVVSPGTLKGALSTDECLGCCSATNARVFQLSGTFQEDGRLVQTLIAPDREAVRAMVASMEDHGHAVTLLKLATVEQEELLTTRQETILLTAMERGFFDDPKGTSLQDLAQTFGVSISTASEILRKATHKVMSSYFDTQ